LPQAVPAAVHALPAQQIWPAPPHWAQMPALLQAVPAATQVLLLQQAWPAPPHTAHELAMHVTAEAVHVWPVQQA
jgi:hypothetical protein